MANLNPSLRKAAIVATVILVVQAALLQSSMRREYLPAAKPLTGFPRDFGNWQMLQEGVIEKEVQDVLQADDLLTRQYVDRTTNTGANLFIAYFQTQRNGKAPHSPKNCLPGSGWTPLVQDRIPVEVGEGKSITVNRYIVQRGDSKSLVLYWYQSRGRAVADEYSAKFWVMADAIRYNRTDTALVRVVIGLSDRVSNEDATVRAKSFVRELYGPLTAKLPS
jgi:EpsI family protein